MIAIIDYGMGNLHSVKNALDFLHIPNVITHDKDCIQQADQLILPGVGAFPDCMKNLKEHDLIDVLNQEVLLKKKPILGICLGMQALFEESEEGTVTKGLGFLKGRIVKMKDEQVKIPHIGWNLLEAQQAHPLFSRLPRPFVYYVHSYYLQEYQQADILGCSRYGQLLIPGLVKHNNIVGAQFHPEKSATDGLTILKWFQEECR